MLVALDKKNFMEENRNDQFKSSQQGSGSAENRGDVREAQQNQTKDLGKMNEQQKQEATSGSNVPLADLNSLGGLSGRDDYAGGDADGMSDQSTGEETDR